MVKPAQTPQNLLLAASLPAGCLLCALMISSFSFWHDEITSALYAQAGSWTEWLHRLAADPASEAQMPLFLAWARCLELLRPESVSPEWFYRAGNLVWISIAIWAFARLGNQLSQPWLPALWLLHPFAWFYVNEFRPYAMQLAGGSLLLLTALGGDEYKTRRNHILLFIPALLLTAGSSMLGFFTLASFSAAETVHQWRSRQPLTAWYKRWMLAGGVLSPLIVYDLWTFLQGAGGAKLWKVGPANLAFSVYEFLGLSGLGPPRNELREAIFQHGLGLQALKALGPVPWLTGCTAGACIMTLLIAGLVKLRRTGHWPLVEFCLMVIIGNWLLLFAAAYCVGFPFWGRHLSPCFPALLVLGGLCASSLPRAIKIPLSCTAALLLLASSLNLRWNPDYQRDDLKGAYQSAISGLHPDGTIWWAASAIGGSYYNEKSPNPLPPESFTPLSPNKLDRASGIQPIDTVVLGRPSLHDPGRTLTPLLQQTGLSPRQSFSGIKIWQAPADL